MANRLAHGLYHSKTVAGTQCICHKTRSYTGLMDGSRDKNEASKIRI